MLNSFPPPPPRSKPRYARPLIGLAVSICVAVVSFSSGLITLCGGSNCGYNKGDCNLDFLAWALFILFCLSILSIVVCFIWFIVALIRGDSE